MTEDLIAALDALSADDAHAAIRRLRGRLGLGMLIMAREDVDSIWASVAPEETGPDGAISDAQWQAVQETWAWQKGFGEDPLMSSAWQLVSEAVTDARAALADGTAR